MVTNYIQQLKKLRNNLANSKMSVMVGAGFSKNVSAKFLGWDQLLHDLCYELFKEEIETAYKSSYTSTRASLHRKKAKSEFVQKIVGEIIKQTGYLNIVSKYIERKGYSESIATYIEERIPDIELKNGRLQMTVGAKVEELSLSKINLHKELLALPWNNIYTTNYDRLLELCIDPDLHDKLVAEIKKLENEIAVLSEVEAKNNEVLKELERLLNQCEGSGPPTEIAGIICEEGDADKAELNKKIKEVQEALTEAGKRKAGNEKLIRFKEAELNHCFTVVKNASQLRLKRNKNIIKLHGSLRTDEERNKHQFGFDGDAAVQYIIAKEHYDSYPQKHEAFTQLMRISLLQESFCLIGFSGVDPNFLAWIGWIRDLLFKHASGKQSNDFKIFLIDVDGKETEDDKQVFFTNHSIVRIPLLQPDILQFLERETHGAWDPQDRIASALQLFLNYLSSDEEIMTAITGFDLSSREQWRSIWEGLNLYDFDKAIRPQVLESAVKDIEEIKTKIVTGDTEYAYTHNQHTLVSSADRLLGLQSRQFPESVDNFLKLLLYAVEDEGAPIKDVLSKKVIDALLSCKKTAERTRRLIERNLSLSPLNVSEPDADLSSYDRILRKAFLFEFGQLKDALDAWEPSFEQLHLKAGFYALFEARKAEELLEQQLNEGERLPAEQRLYSTELLSFIRQSKLNFDKKTNRIIRQFEQIGYDTLTNHFKFLQQQLEPKLPKPEPYGKNRYLVSSMVSFKVHGKEDIALQYLMQLVNSGFQLSFAFVHLTSADKWYPIFSTAFERYPLPFIFYSLQHSGEDFLKRAGQDVAYSDQLQGELPVICKMLLKGYRSAPVYIQGNVLSFLSKIFIGTSPDVWQDGFLKIWKSLVHNKQAFGDRYFDAHNFIKEGIKYIEDKSILVEIVMDCIQHVDTHSKQSILYLYTLNSNVHLKKVGPEAIPDGLKRYLDTLITELPMHAQNNMFLLGNLHGLLSKEQISRIGQQLDSIDFTSIQNERIWHVFLYFTGGKKELTDKIKAAIVDHPLLWFTGIEGNTLRKMGHGFLALSSVTRYHEDHDSRGIVWRKEEVQRIYEKMKPALADIERMTKRDLGLFSFGFELEEMKLFLDSFKTQLSDETDFSSIYERVSALYDKEREYASVDEGLTSQDGKQVVWALSELSKNIELGKKSEELVMLVLNRVLFQMRTSLDECLAYIARWMQDKNNEGLFRKHIATLKQVLIKFKTHQTENADVPFIEEKLVRIAVVLQSWGVDDKIIEWWIDKGQYSRFNNIKQFMLRGKEDQE